MCSNHCWCHLHHFRAVPRTLSVYQLGDVRFLRSLSCQLGMSCGLGDEKYILLARRKGPPFSKIKTPKLKNYSVFFAFHTISICFRHFPKNVPLGAPDSSLSLPLQPTHLSTQQSITLKQERRLATD